MKKTILKCITLLLAFLMIFMSVPTLADSDITLTPSTPSVDSQEEKTVLNDAAQSSDTKIKEIVSLREEHVKHFQMPDGTMQAIVFPNAVHEKDENGSWQPIDSTVSLINNRDATMYVSKDGKKQFSPCVTNDQSLYTLAENGYSIAVSLENTLIQDSSKMNETTKSAIVTTDAPNHNIEWDSVDEAIAASINKSTLIYPSVYPNTDIEYTIFGDAIKENIVLKSASCGTMYRFKYHLVGLYAVLNKNGSISFYDTKTNELQYRIPAPYMYDYNGEISKDVYYALDEIEDDTYLITVIANETWLKDSARAYPVKIDPTVVSNSKVNDTFVSSASPNTSYGDSLVRISPSCTAFFQAIMPQLPTGASINSALLYIYYYYTSGVTGSRTIAAYQMNAPWDEINTTYNVLFNTYGSSLGISSTMLKRVGARASSNVTASNPRKLSFDVTTAVTSWYNGTSNYGIALMHQSDSLESTSASSTDTMIHNYEAFSNYTAYFSIVYDLPSGVYALKKQSSSVYAHNVTVDSLAWVFQEPLTSLSLNETNRDYLFKFAYRPETDDYVIRSMSNNEIIIYPSLDYNKPLAGKRVVSEMPATDANLPTTYTWKITSSLGYDQIWYLDGTTKYYLCSPSDEGDTRLTLTTDATDDGTKWNFERYTGESFDNTVQISYSDLLMLGETYDYNMGMYSTVVGRNGPITYSVTERDNSPTDKATIDPVTGVLTTLKGGMVRVKWTYAGAPYVWSRLVTISFEDGIIHTLKNLTSNQLMLPVNANSDSFVTLDSYDYNKTTEMWKFEYAGNGYYKIRNDVTGYYLTAPNNNTDNAKVTQAAYDPTYGLWMIQRTSDGYYTLQSKNQYERTTSTPLYLTVNDSNEVIQSTSTTNYKWDISPLIMRMNVLYDQAFKDWYSNYMDLLHSVYSENSIGISIAEVFKERFGISLQVIFNSSTYESYPYIENCLHKTSVETICKDCKNQSNNTDAVECDQGKHHKFELSLLHTLPAIRPYNSTQTNILFTGYKACYSKITRDENGNIISEHHQDAPYAHGWAGYTRVAIMAYTHRDELPNQEFDNIISTITHETLHTLLVPHCENEDECIMLSPCQNATRHLAMCNDCLQIANANKFQFYNHQ